MDQFTHTQKTGHSHPSELFEFSEVIFHQMPPLVNLLVILALDFAVGFGWDHSSCSARVDVL